MDRQIMQQTGAWICAMVIVTLGWTPKAHAQSCDATLARSAVLQVEQGKWFNAANQLHTIKMIGSVPFEMDQPVPFPEDSEEVISGEFGGFDRALRGQVNAGVSMGRIMRESPAEQADVMGGEVSGSLHYPVREVGRLDLSFCPTATARLHRSVGSGDLQSKASVIQGGGTLGSQLDLGKVDLFAAVSLGLAKYGHDLQYRDFTWDEDAQELVEYTRREVMSGMDTTTELRLGVRYGRIMILVGYGTGAPERGGQGSLTTGISVQF